MLQCKQEPWVAIEISLLRQELEDRVLRAMEEQATQEADNLILWGPSLEVWVRLPIYLIPLMKMFPKKTKKFSQNKASKIKI